MERASNTHPGKAQAAKMHRIRRIAVASLVVASAARAAPLPSVAVEARPRLVERRWTDETPDSMIEDAKARAKAKGAPESDVLAAAITIDALAGRALYGHAQAALEEIAGAAPLSDVSADVRSLARSMAPDEGTDAGTLEDAKVGVVSKLAILGPFRDTGGGLDAKDGPEAKGASFADLGARYSWGTVEVGWRPVAEHYATARGVPLDLFVYPRKESCTWVATKVSLPSDSPLTVHLASSGSARLMFDGVHLDKSDDVHSSAKLDRLAARVIAPAGAHLVAAKICTGALDDDGRVRLRITGDGGAPPAFVTSADLGGTTLLSAAPTSWKQKRLGTPLSRALAVETSTDLALDAAILRSLGGADDLKSPRAPGILDSIEQGKELDADRLAMVGWIAPSGANRSGWLNLAAERASRSQDARTRAFAERRLVAERANARMLDWAIATARGANIGTIDPEALLIHATIDEELGTDALRTGALRKLSQAMDANPTTVPSSLLLELAPLAAQYDA